MWYNAQFLIKPKDLFWIGGFIVLSLLPGLLFTNILDSLLSKTGYLEFVFFTIWSLELPMILTTIFVLIYTWKKSIRFQLITVFIAQLISFILTWFFGPDRTISDSCGTLNIVTSHWIEPGLSNISCIIHTLFSDVTYSLAWLWILTAIILGAKKLAHWATAFILMLVISLLTIVSLPFLAYSQKHRNDSAVEQETKKEIEDIVSKHPEMHIDRLILWEGDSTDTISIKDKGSISFWYKKGGSPIIDAVKLIDRTTYDITFQCENNENGKRTYAFNTGLEVTKGSALGYLFNFEIKTIEDLSTHFDSLVSALKTFPVQKETISLTDSSGTRDFIKNPDLNYAFKIRSGEKAVCYRYIRVLEK